MYTTPFLNFENFKLKIVNKISMNLLNICVRVLNDERMQSGDGCRSRVECRRDDAETRGRAEAEANAEQRTRREQSRAEVAAAIAEAEPKPEADAETEEEQRRSREKPAEFRAMKVKSASRNLLEKSAAI